jgi:hypothetical protein
MPGIPGARTTVVRPGVPASRDQQKASGSADDEYAQESTLVPPPFLSTAVSPLLFQM